MFMLWISLLTYSQHDVGTTYPFSEDFHEHNTRLASSHYLKRGGWRAGKAVVGFSEPTRRSSGGCPIENAMDDFLPGNTFNIFSPACLFSYKRNKGQTDGLLVKEEKLSR